MQVKRSETRGDFVIEYIGGALAVVAVVLLFISAQNRTRAVGRNIAPEDIEEFFYTYASSTYPPDYQRYHFYKENGRYKFSHEKREGCRWPLTESDVTRSGSMELSEEEWLEFLSYLKDGKVKKRKENSIAGGSGPWLYLYWKGDKGKYQEFFFFNLKGKKAFEEFCAALALPHEKYPENVVSDEKQI